MRKIEIKTSDSFQTYTSNISNMKYIREADIKMKYNGNKPKNMQKKTLFKLQRQ